MLHVFLAHLVKSITTSIIYILHLLHFSVPKALKHLSHIIIFTDHLEKFRETLIGVPRHQLSTSNCLWRGLVGLGTLIRRETSESVLVRRRLFTAGSTWPR